MILSRTKYIILAVVALLPFLLWKYVVSPRLVVAVPQNLNLSYEVLSLDNLYDPEHQVFSGELPSKTTFTYKVTDVFDDVLSVENTFDVRSLSNEPIFSVKRLYGINRFTGKHVPQFGDQRREGYLFAPRGLKKGESFTYWHINYDAPAHMEFVDTEEMQGIEVYRYETEYSGQTIDQTAQLANLPGVPESRRVLLEPMLTLWVEPDTGLIVTYKDVTTAYYHDRESGERLFPWNRFSNTFSEKTVEENINFIQSRRFIITLQTVVVPGLLSLIPVLLFLYALLPESAKKILTFIHHHLKWQQILSVVLLVGAMVVIVGWILDIEILKSFYPGLVTMKFSTALSFSISALILFFGINSELRYSDTAKLLLPILVLQISLLMGIQFLAAVLGIHTGIESLFIAETDTAVFSSGPGIPSVGTMLAFLLVSVIGTLSIIHMENKETIYKLIGLVIMMISVFALIGYVTDFPLLYYYVEGKSTAMSFHTAIYFFLIASIVFSSKHEEDGRS